MSKTALITIDLQPGLKALSHYVFRQNPADFDTLLQQNQLAVNWFTQQHLPVFNLVIQPPLLPRRFSQSLLITTLNDSSCLLGRSKPSAFSQPNLIKRLRQAKVQTVVITGLTTDNGIAKTVADAEGYGLTTIVISDATLARTPALQAANLAKFHKVCTWTEFLATQPKSHS
jgi:nicotinamidase-related amidase